MLVISHSLCYTEKKEVVSIKSAYTEPFDWFRYFTQNPRLKYLFLELTDCCNLRCLHCGSSCSTRGSRFLPREAIRRVLQSVAESYDPGTVMVCVTGGEPLLHPQFFDIMNDVSQLGFPWGMTTNGTLIDELCARKLKAIHMGSVSVSLDGLEEAHDWLRSQKGAYQRAVHGVRCMIEAGIPVQITSVIHRKNIDSLNAMLDAYTALGAYSWRPINMEPIGRALEQDNLLLTPNEHRSLLCFIRNKRQDESCPIHVTYGCSHFLPHEFEKQVRPHQFRCGAGIFIASIQANGDISACLDIQRRPELVQGNIAKDDFMDVWQHRFEAFRIDRADQCADCRNCPDKHECHGDSAHTWDYDRKEPLLCLRKALKEGML